MSRMRETRGEGRVASLSDSTSFLGDSQGWPVLNRPTKRCRTCFRGYRVGPGIYTRKPAETLQQNKASLDLNPRNTESRRPPGLLPLERLRRIRSCGKQDPGRRFPWSLPPPTPVDVAASGPSNGGGRPTEGMCCSHVSGQYKSAGGQAHGRRRLVGRPDYCSGGGLALLIVVRRHSGSIWA
jgi:hypothetical protein